MRRNFKLGLGVLLFMVGLLLGLFKYDAYVSKDSKDFKAQSMEYWNTIIKECEPDIDYILAWFESNKKIYYVSLQGDGSVYYSYKKSNKGAYDLDNRITEFVKRNDVDIVNPKKEDGNVILFRHDFFVKKRITGSYVLIHYKDERRAQDSYYDVARDYYYKIKSNYYCTFSIYE